MADEAKEIADAEMQETLLKGFLKGHLDSHSASRLADLWIGLAFEGTLGEGTKREAIKQPIVSMISRNFQRQVRLASGQLTPFMKKEENFKIYVQRVLKAMDKDLTVFFIHLQRKKELQNQLYLLKQRWIRSEKNAYQAWLNYSTELDLRQLQKDLEEMERLEQQLEALRQQTVDNYENKRDYYEHALQDYQQSLKAMKGLAAKYGIDLNQAVRSPELIVLDLQGVDKKIKKCKKRQRKCEFEIKTIQQQIVHIGQQVEKKQDIDSLKQHLHQAREDLKQEYIHGLASAMDSERTAKLFVDRSAKLSQCLAQPIFGLDNLLELERLGMDVGDLESQLMSQSKIKSYMQENRLMDPRELKQITQAWVKVKSSNHAFKVPAGEALSDHVRQDFIQQLQAELPQFDSELVNFWVDRFEQGSFDPEVDFVTMTVNTFTVEEELKLLKVKLDEQKRANELYAEITESFFSRVYEQDETLEDDTFWRSIETEFENAMISEFGHAVEPPLRQHIQQEKRMEFLDVLEQRNEHIHEITEREIKQLHQGAEDLSQILKEKIEASKVEQARLAELGEHKGQLEQELFESRLCTMNKTVKELVELTESQLDLCEQEMELDLKIQDLDAAILNVHKRILEDQKNNHFSSMQDHYESIEALQAQRLQFSEPLSKVLDQIANQERKMSALNERLVYLTKDEPQLKQGLPHHLKAVHHPSPGTYSKGSCLTQHYQSSKPARGAGIKPTAGDKPRVKVEPHEVDFKGKKPKPTR